ncbi:MAG: hypothetical protein ACTSQ8_23590, partial [Candidatus Helarchaeota archaeon]
NTFINNSKVFSFIADFEVVNVSLFYYLSGTENFIANMNSVAPDKFEYLWQDIQEHTNTSTGDTIGIIVKLTDILGNANEYYYNFTADFTKPVPAVSVGNGFENYQTNLVANPLTKILFSCSETGKEKEFYRIFDLNVGSYTQWVEFNSSGVSKLADLSDLPEKFSILYKVIDSAGNSANITTYNNGFNYIKFTRETSITWANNTIDLNDLILYERELSFADNGQFGGVDSLDIYINGFKYGTAHLDNGYYKIQFGSENSIDTLLAYSKSLKSDNIYSNINPIAHICWEVDNSDSFGVVKHVVINGDIVIINPLTYNSTITMRLDNLYSQKFILPNFVRPIRVYYYNITSDNASAEECEIVRLSYGDYVINASGYVKWSDNSIIHDLFANRSECVKDGLIYIDYAASDFADQLLLKNAEGFAIDFYMPSLYYDHTTIESLTVSFDTFLGASFSKVFFDLDLRKYFQKGVKDQYEVEAFGLGNMMKIPLYIGIDELSFSNPNQLFNPRFLETITFTISDSKLWPGSFVKNYSEYTVLDLPYQRIAVGDIRLYNFISDSAIEDEDGYLNSTIEVKAPDYHNYFAFDEFKIKRINAVLTNVKIYHAKSEITAATNVEYSDFIEVYARINGSCAPIALDELINVPLSLINVTSGHLYSLSNMHWITKRDLAAPYMFDKNYYYAKFEVPKSLGFFELTIGSDGTPIHNIIIDNVPKFNITVVQESLSISEPIYLEEEAYDLEYQNSLVLEGAVLDNDKFIVEDEVYDYSYQDALDSETIHHLKVVSPFNDENFVDKNKFAIYYIDRQLEKVPLYVNLDGVRYKDERILSKDPEILYLDNAFLLHIYWNTSDDNNYFINYDTNLLISYTVLKGRPISPLSFSSCDSFGNDKQENLVEIPFTRYNIITNDWEFEGDFTEVFAIDRILLVKEVKESSITIRGPQFEDDDGGLFFRHGIIGVDNLYVKKNDSNTYEVVSEEDYNWYVENDGDLYVSYPSYQPNDTIKVLYYSYNPVPITHSLRYPGARLNYIRVYSRDNLSITHTFSNDIIDEFAISSDGYKIYFYDLYNAILKGGDFDLYDIFEISYRSTYTKKIDLSSNLLLLLQDSESHYVPIDNVEIDNLGFFKYNKRLTADGPLSLPIGGKIVNMRLDYLPITVYNKSGESNVFINYDLNVDSAYHKRYAYKESDKWFKNFKIITTPKKVKLEMADFTTQNIVVSQSFTENRKYYFSSNPAETLEKGEEFTSIQIDALAREDYRFTFKLTDFSENPIKDSICWMHIGFMPKSKTKFLNEKAIIEGTEDHPYYESLGTHPLSLGPGVGPN